MSTTVSSTSSYSSTNRVTGLVSGMDVDSIVKSLMDAEKVSLNKVKQKRQLSEWKQEAYRDISNKLRAFNDEYFNYASSTGNMLSKTSYQKFAADTSDDSVVSATASSDATAGTHTVTVSNLATYASLKSTQGVTKTITASSSADFSGASGKSFYLTVDGNKTEIKIDSSVTSIDSLQEKIDSAVGSGKILVSDTNGDGSGTLTFSKADGSGIGTISLSENTGALKSLGFSTDGKLDNYIDTTDTLEEISAYLDTGFTFDSDNNLNLTINNVNFEFSKTTTLKDMISKINSSDANVTMKYSTLSDSFVITADETGAGDKINISESGSTFLTSVNLTNYTAGEDAKATIDGEEIVRSGNTITIDGVTYNLNAESTTEQKITISQDSDAIYDNIKNFVDDYNALISDLNSIISESYDRDYQPLTDDEKDEMSEDEITSWEEKAKTGILENDSTVQSLLSNMRQALYQSVEGVSTHLTDIGITTSSDYTDKGKLIIDESALKEAIESDPEGVMDLFSQQSSTYSGTSTVRSLTSSQRETRTSEEGLAYRIYDILQDNISTYTGKNGKKGLLIEKAGLEGDGSEYDNTLSDQISKYDDEIDDMMAKLDDKEDYYYDKYSTMETYINQMNSQLESLQSYLS